MKLGFYYHIPATIRSGQICVPGYFGRFLDSLAEYFDLSLFLHAPDPNEVCFLEYEIKSKNVSLFPLPPRKSLPYRLLHQQKYLRIIEGNKKDFDVFMIRAPSPLLPSIARSIHPTPAVLLIVGDYLAGISSLPQPGWRKFLIRLVEWCNYRGQLRAAKHSLVFVNSHLLYDHYQGKVNSLIETRTTTLTKDDFYIRGDTCQTRPIHLLYTGRMDPSKGLLDMVKALSLLVHEGEDIVLDFVGWSESNSDILDQIYSTAKQEGVEGRVFYHGYKSVGPELFAYYKMADIYLIASQASEGFPRTIWEAMTHSLPVVATRVGSIPNFIEGAAELVEPRDPSALAHSIQKLILNSELRKKYMARALNSAKENTLETQVGKMSREIIQWVEEKN